MHMISEIWFVCCSGLREADKLMHACTSDDLMLPVAPAPCLLLSRNYVYQLLQQRIKS